MRYSIEETTLTNIGDALRRKHGETKMGTVMEDLLVPASVISKTPNATGFDTWEGSYRDREEWDFEDSTYYYIFNVVHIPTAKSVSIKYKYELERISPYDTIAVGNGDCKNITEWYANGNATASEIYGSSDGYLEKTIEDTDTITFRIKIPKENVATLVNKLGYYAEVWGLDENGNPLEEEVIQVEVEKEVLNTYSSAEMADAIDAITGDAPTDKELTFEGICQYKFYKWDWFINKYGDRITTEDISNCNNMFADCTEITNILFDINCKLGTKLPMTNMFANCYKLQNAPIINNATPDSMNDIFRGCRSLRNIPEDIESWFDWSNMESQTSAYNGSRSSTFNECHSLRSFPMNFLAHGNPVGTYSYAIYNNCFYTCYTLDEIIGMPFPHLNATWTSNAFTNYAQKCNRLKNMTFAVQEDGTPYAVNWKSQTIDLSSNTGYANSKTNILDNNSGITADKEVKDDATYQALKDDPDWWTMNIAYSRYNHASAVATINSLPDASAYLATAGGTNTIKFKGAAGSATDGGAINTLTEEEIAVAAAKGWTVSLV